jgi:Xaa-Pro aminopeptidase
VPPQLLAARRAALMGRLGTGVVVVRSAEEREDEAHAQDSSFRQDDDFFYLTGVEEAGSVLVGVADGAGGGRWRLYVPERVPAQEQWTGARLGPGAEAVALTGVADVRAAARVVADAPELLAAGGGAGGTLWVGGAAPRSCAVRGAGCMDALVAPFAAGAGGTVAPLGPQLAGLRLMKDADELRRMRQAIAITVAAQREAMGSAAPGQHEYEVEAVIEAAFRRRGAERVGFPSIVGSGPNSTVLHYDANRREMRSGDLVVMDIGAEYGYYTADVTRTIPVTGRFTARQRAVYDLVLGAQQAAIDSVRPGTTLGWLELIAREYMRANSGTICGGGSCDRFFIHGLSHWLGMDVHDVGSYATTLQPGMVLTVEPGVYLPGESPGVRIEDDVLVTAAGHEVLSAGAPRQAAEVEQLMHAAAAPAAAKR